MVDVEKTNRKGFPVKIRISGTWQCFTQKAIIELRDKLNKITSFNTKVSK